MWDYVPRVAVDNFFWNGWGAHDATAAATAQARPGGRSGERVRELQRR